MQSEEKSRSLATLGMTFRRRPTRGESRKRRAGEMQDGLKSASTQLGEHNGGGSAAADGAVEFNLGSLWTGWGKLWL